jgi:uncharacterized protein (TIGR03437 family)
LAAAVTLEATPQPGFVFAGWEGDCQGTGACKLLMNGPRSVKADFAPAQTLTPAISSGGVAGAGLSVPAVAALSPNGLAIVFGNGFAPAGTLSVAGPGNLLNGKVSTELDGVCVLVGNTRAPVLAVTSTQINFQAPRALPPDSAEVQVITGCGTANEHRSEVEVVAVQSAAPEFFYFVQTAAGRNPIAAVNVSRGGYVGSNGLLPGSDFAPAKPGDVVTLYATGLGVTNPVTETGEIPASANAITGDLQVTDAGTALAKSDILYAGVAPGNAGLYQINIRLPKTIAAGDQPVTVTVNGSSSPAGGYLTVKP